MIEYAAAVSIDKSVVCPYWKKLRQIKSQSYRKASTVYEMNETKIQTKFAHIRTSEMQILVLLLTQRYLFLENRLFFFNGSSLLILQQKLVVMFISHLPFNIPPSPWDPGETSHLICHYNHQDYQELFKLTKQEVYVDNHVTTKFLVGPKKPYQLFIVICFSTAKEILDNINKCSPCILCFCHWI